VNHKGETKDHIGQVLSQPVARTNHFLIENASQIVKEKQRNASNQRQTTKVNKTTTKKQWRKSIIMYREVG